MLLQIIQKEYHVFQKEFYLDLMIITHIKKKNQK